MIEERRHFITGAGILLASACAGLSIKAQAKEERNKVTPVEDLEQEHGLIQRLLLIYDEALRHLSNGQDFDLHAFHAAAKIMREFVEDYHEKQEEDFLFPRFEKAHKLAELSKTLRSQHDAGRRLTDQILELTKSAKASGGAATKLVDTLNRFVRMYRVHAAREDTVLFPALRTLVSSHEYDALGEEFEKKEHAMFGKDGFDSMLDKVAGIEKSLGIYDLNQFTPE